MSSLRAVRGAIRDRARLMLPRAVLRQLRPNSIPTPGRVAFGDFRRTRPISRHFGWERGQPIDRYYIERFLAEHVADIQGRVLEVGDASYTHRFGGARVTRSDVLHVDAGAKHATFVADLSGSNDLPADTFDCIVLTQTLHLIFDVAAAVATLRRILAPGGVLLATVPGITPVDRGEWSDTWHWSFTMQSARRTFEAQFRPDEVAVEQHGNVLAAIAFLQGLASHELTEAELAVVDPAYPVFLGIRAVKRHGQ